MIQKQYIPELVTAEEAAGICRRAGTHSSIQRAIAVIKQFDPQAAHFILQRWALTIAVAAVYDTGRIQGIREERRKAASRSPL
ncbi:MAG: hypothetical protein IJ555_05950 [Ruminococcus sp.]|nr:hypothetical protein [Ruminococcus sp.]